jgi:hypothetical protein
MMFPRNLPLEARKFFPIRMSCAEQAACNPAAKNAGLVKRECGTPRLWGNCSLITIILKFRSGFFRFSGVL